MAGTSPVMKMREWPDARPTRLILDWRYQVVRPGNDRQPGRVAFGSAERASVHDVAWPYQSAICRPCQNSVPGRAAMWASAFSNQPIRCGTPLI